MEDVLHSQFGVSFQSSVKTEMLIFSLSRLTDFSNYTDADR